MLNLATGDPAITEQVVATMLTRQAWQSWAERAVVMQVSEADRSTGDLTRFLLEGKSLFDEYRQADTRATDLIVGQRDRAISDQRTTLVVLPLAFLLATAIAWTRARLRRRRLARTLLEPIRRLLATIERLGAGDLAARAPAAGVGELDAVGSALGALAGDLAVAHDLAAAREQRLAVLAGRLEMVVGVAREVSGSLSIRYVAETVTSAAADLLGAPATLWVRNEAGQFTAARRSDDPHGRTPASDLSAPSLVSESAAAARPLSDAMSRAYPLVLAGMVVGVLHATTPTADEDTEQVLQALLSTAAAALESARLNNAAHERAEIDAITQLPNRRRMESDLRSEWERSRRFDRPLSFVMVDLDHFKQLNDTYGHPTGDAALNAVASALKAGLRATDTAYRYGGEEFAILLRETDLDAGANAAERIRAAIATVTVPGSDLTVTASLGLAERATSMNDLNDLVAAADAALYTAKRTGRDRVVEHPRTPTS
jgi:diguanylate cyclase (GGDEF)-like protein